MSDETIESNSRPEGPTRANRMMALAGASAWLVILAIWSCFDERIGIGLLAVLAVPYAFVLWRIDRAARAARRDLAFAEVVEWMGAYFVWVWIVCRAHPPWGDLLVELSGPQASVALLLWAGLALLGTGVAVRFARNRVSASPR